MSEAIPRPEITRELSSSEDFGVVQKELTIWEQLFNQVWLRKCVLLVVIAVIWEVYGRQLDNPLLVPTFSDTVSALWSALISGVLPDRTLTTLKVLAIGFSVGVFLAAVLTILAITTQLGTDFLETVTAMFSPLPAIALLPLALIWFGLGIGSLIFVMVHSVLWPLALNTHAGFRAVSPTLRMVGRNYGLGGLGLVLKILIPAAFPFILAIPDAFPMQIILPIS